MNSTERIYRSGTARRVVRTVVPLAGDLIAGGVQRLFGQSSRPRRDTSYPDFSTSTAPDIPAGEPGTLLRTQRIEAVGTTGPNPAETTRFEFLTTDAHDRLLVAGGAYFRPRNPSGVVIGFAPGTQGGAAHCDPSLACTVGVATYFEPPCDRINAYEQLAINYFLASGCEVIITDYPRDPVTGVQLYCDNPAGARSLADAIRASRSLGVDDSRLGLWGYSQGGGTIGKMVEDTTYAPDVQPSAAVAGAPPADLAAVLKHVDGAMITGVIAYTLAGLMSSDVAVRDELLPVLTEKGFQQILDNTTTCLAGTVALAGFRPTDTWFTTGQRMGDMLDQLPETTAAFERSRLGTGTPQCPTLLWSSHNDDIIPYEAVAATRDAWAGDNLTWLADDTPRIPGRTGFNHSAPYVKRLTSNVGWLLDQIPR